MTMFRDFARYAGGNDRLAAGAFLFLAMLAVIAGAVEIATPPYHQTEAHRP